MGFVRVPLDFLEVFLAGFIGIRETLAKRAGRPVSAQKTRPVTMPLGSGGVGAVVWACEAVTRSEVQRRQRARTSFGPLDAVCMELDDGGQGSSMRLMKIAGEVVALELVGPV